MDTVGAIQIYCPALLNELRGLMQPYLVRQIDFETGEHLPILVDTRTGLPVFSVLNYTLSNLRATGQAVNTIVQFCRVMALLHYWLEHTKVDFLERCMTGQLLHDAEVDRLENLFRLDSKTFCLEVVKRYAPKAAVKPVRISKVVSLEKLRRAPTRRKALPEVSSVTLTIRLQHARAYLTQLALEYSGRATTSPEKRDAVRAAATLMSNKFRALCPNLPTSKETPAPEGLGKDQVALLLQLVKPASENTRNPWKNPFVRKRNQLMVLTLVATGMRGGELLKMKTSDLSRHNAVISIRRTPDDVEDPRQQQPQAKTLGRELLIAPELYAGINDFILTDRRAIPARQRKHPFVWVAVDGAPLSLQSLYKMFRELRATEPALSETFTAHLLRYTATDELFDNLNKSKGDEDQMASQMRYVMGWSADSNMPEKYAKRVIREKSNNALLAMQATLLSSPKSTTDEI